MAGSLVWLGLRGWEREQRGSRRAVAGPQSRAAHPAELPLLRQQAMFPAWQGISMGRSETPKLGAMKRGFAFLKQQQVGHSPGGLSI